MVQIITNTNDCLKVKASTNIVFRGDDIEFLTPSNIVATFPVRFIKRIETY